MFSGTFRWLLFTTRVFVYHFYLDKMTNKTVTFLQNKFRRMTKDQDYFLNKK